MIAALYVQHLGVYYGLPDVDPWGLPERDARLYAGNAPVVAHPPCARWCRLAGLVESLGGLRRGCDDGCFAAALEAVRRCGGVLEHPEGSAAWPAYGLLAPPRAGGWVAAGDWKGWTCCVEQGHYGHRAAKRTWLYAVGVDLPVLTWGPSEAVAHHAGLSRARAAEVQRAPEYLSNLSKRARSATPLPFRDLLISMARSVR